MALHNCTEAGDQDKSSLLDRIAYQKGNEMLDLSVCSLSVVPAAEIREHFGEPLFLDLSFNSIRSLSTHFAPDFKSVTKLDLSRNEIRRLPQNFGDLMELQYLDLSQNKLRDLPLSMGKLTQLQYLNIFRNPFHSPICDLLGEHQDRLKSTIADAVITKCVITFLQKVSTELSSSSPNQSEGGKGIRRKKSVTFLQDSNANENDECLQYNRREDSDYSTEGSERRLRRSSSGNLYHRSKESWLSRSNVSKIIAILLFWGVVLPFLFVLIMDSSYFDHRIRGTWMEYFFTMYHPFDWIAEAISRHRKVILRGPGQAPASFSATIRATLAVMFGCIRDSFVHSEN